jgi:putative sterol carrier protein
MGQNVQWTCIYEEWVPTSGFDKVINAMPEDELNEILAESGLTKEDVLAMLNFLSNMDVSKNDAEVVCEGELTDNFWKINMTGSFAGVEFLMKGDVTFEGDSMITNSTMEMDWGTEATCKAYMNTEDDDEDDEDAALDKELYGDVVKTETKCNGSRMVQMDKLVKKNVTDAARKAAYDDMLGKCKDYRDGKISYEELMMD